MYYSPLEQFEPIPYFLPFKLGFFYIFGTNVTYILLLLLGIFFFINGSFWSLINNNKFNKDLYSKLICIDNVNSLSLLKVIALPFSYIVYFYKNIVFGLFFKASNSLFKVISLTSSYLIVSYKKNLFKSFNNYSINEAYLDIYNFIFFKHINHGNLFSVLPYNFNQLKNIKNNFNNNYFFIFYEYFIFFLSFLRN